MKIVFMGTSTFAVPILQRLIDSEHSVICVYTKAPSKQARGMMLCNSPVHDLANQYHIPVMTPKNFRDQTEVDRFISLNADVAIVAAYGLIIPNTILNIYKFGCINIHPSDLPQWRGAAPIQRSMMAGDRKTAICVMKMDEGIDTGPIYSKHNLELNHSKNIHQLTQEYSEIGAELLVEVLKKLSSGKVMLTQQSEDNISYAHKILPKEERIDWFNASNIVHGTIMALTPNAYFLHNGLKIKAIESNINNTRSLKSPGTVVSNKQSLEIVCGDNTTINITQLQKPGGKVLNAKAFLCGYQIPVDTILE